MPNEELIETMDGTPAPMLEKRNLGTGMLYRVVELNGRKYADLTDPVRVNEGIPEMKSYVDDDAPEGAYIRVRVFFELAVKNIVETRRSVEVVTE